MNLGLDGQNALVTGARRGIGLAVTRALVAEGAHVVAGARHKSPELRSLVAAGSVHEVEVDLSTAAGPIELVAAAHQHGPLDILVNNVGAVKPRPGGFLEVTDEDWLGSFTLTFRNDVVNYFDNGKWHGGMWRGAAGG